MRVLVVLTFLLFLVSPALACSSDCYQCHSHIPTDREHKVLKSCTKCHPEHSDESMTSCGADCFDCHSYKKVMSSSKAHRVLVRCVECHKELKEKELPSYYKEIIGG